ncbi:MAG: GNAT family N-acetyltransferase [Cyclobacteriaceae bacterium]
MRQATPTDRPFVIKTIAAAFHDNKSTNYVIKQDSQTPVRLRRLVGYCYNMCRRFGDVWMSDDGKACALVMLPHRQKTTAQTIGWDIKLATGAIGITRVGKMMARESAIKKNHPMQPFAYLWYIGVDPQQQGRGSGSSLLSGIIDHYAKQDLPLYLETSMERNLPWYTKHGFEAYHHIDFGFTLHMLRREVRQA